MAVPGLKRRDVWRALGDDQANTRWSRARHVTNKLVDTSELSDSRQRHALGIELQSKLQANPAQNFRDTNEFHPQ